MAYQRRRYLRQDTQHNSGGGFLNAIASIFGGGKGPTYTGDTTGYAEGDNTPLAKPGTFVDNRNFFDRLKGQPDLASQYNAQMTMDQLAQQQATQQAIALAKARLPIEQSLQTSAADQAIRQNLGQQQDLMRMKDTAVLEAENRAA